MLPASRHMSKGRMSAPFQDPASKASKMPQATRPRRLVRGTVIADAGMDGVLTEALTAAPQTRHISFEMPAALLGGTERGKLFVNVGQLDLFVGSGQVGIGFKLVAGLEQFQLANRDQLVVGGGFEAGEFGQLEQVVFFLLTALAVGVEEIANLGFTGFRQVLADDQGVQRNQRRGPDDADVIELLG